VGGKSDAQYQYQVRWTNGVIRWDSRENLLRYSCCRKLLEERPIPTALSADDQGYHGKIKYIVVTPQIHRDIECTIGVQGAVAPVTSKKKKQQLSLRAEGQKRIKLVTGIVKKVKAPLKLLSQLVLQFWMEVGKAIFGCLSPRNYVNTRKEKKPRRVFIPPTLYN
jgi:hypothetical protein